MQVIKQREYPCPVCGYGLDTPPADFIICPSSGVEFGYSDVGTTYKELRREWIKFGAHWTSRVVPQPVGWNAWSQLIGAKFAADLPYLKDMKITQETAYVPIRFFADRRVPQLIEVAV
jgi:hypothetical protein